MSIRRVVVVGLLGGVVAIALFTVFQVRAIWSDLRADAALDLPPGYAIVEHDERGTAFCVITCSGEGEAAIQLLVAGTVGADPCVDLHDRLARRHPSITTTMPLGLLGCLFAERSRDGYLTVESAGIGCAGDARPCARVRLSSGIE